MRLRVKTESLLGLTISTNMFYIVLLFINNLKRNTVTRRYPEHRPSVELRLWFHRYLKHCKSWLPSSQFGSSQSSSWSYFTSLEMAKTHTAVHWDNYVSPAKWIQRMLRSTSAR